MGHISSEQISAAVAGQTIPSQFLKVVEANRDRIALKWQKPDGSWGQWTFAEYADVVARVAAGLRARGLEPGKRMMLMVRNTPEFHVLDMAAYFCGATPVSIYNSSSAEQVAYLAKHSESCLAVAEDEGLAKRFTAVRSRLPALAQLGVVRDGAAGADFTWNQLVESKPIDLAAGAALAKPDGLATLIYTSGTTGDPKAVMISHHNVAWTIHSLGMLMDEVPGFGEYAGKRLVSYLPMAHIAERVVSHYQQAFHGLEVWTCPDPTKIADYFRAAKPQVVFGVPRVWEKLYAGIQAAVSADPARAQQLAGAVNMAGPIRAKIDADTATDAEKQQYAFIDQVGFSKLRAMLGFDEVKVAITGAAPITAELLSWFRTVGIPLSEVYGMSENSGPMTWTAVNVRPGTVGKALPGCEIKLAEDGEICCRGGHVFQGYLNDPEKTAQALDADGWLHTGDIGTVDEDGYYRIVDRKKELIITAGGKNISPANLEANLKRIPLVGQACAIGDRRPFVSALVVLDPDVARAWAQKNGIETTDLAELAKHPKVVEAINGQLEEVMANFNNAERVKKVAILGTEWLPDSEELTPTSKLKRRGIHAKYAAEIEALYR
ncbi:MAG: long-chain fatty acid--CoA ligase [Deltaproteobacteria bacterium]|nr:long-chain fatty acid--CoA ligase [Deltaproteobacteria bacterium]